MNKLEVTRQLIQWAIELSEFDDRYQPRSAIKTQVLADFIAEFTPNQGKQDGEDEAQKWVVNVDGSSTLYAGGIGVILKSQEGDKLKFAAIYNTKPPIMKLNIKRSLKDWNWLSP